MRAFIFSLDAFVAFTLALVAIYSLIFFSSIPSAYYYLLTQGHYLSRDVLLSMSTTECISEYGVCPAEGSVIDNIVAQHNPSLRKNIIQNTAGELVPDQFGYIMELSEDEGQTWSVMYDTASEPSDTHAKRSKKLMVATQVMTFGFDSTVRKLQTSPYRYDSCWGDGVMGLDEGSGAGGTGGASGDIDFGVIVCGIVNSSAGGGHSGGGAYADGTPFGNIPPNDLLGGQLVPSSDVNIVKLTVYI